jgi:aspartate aminotransferase-like enzyme
MSEELDTLLEEIKSTETHLAELRKEYREKRTMGLRDAIAARNEADAAIREELKALGYRYTGPRMVEAAVNWRNIA